jgi:hypothetical protein
MSDQTAIPRTPPPTLQALFHDAVSARNAIEAMLQGGFHSEQIGLLRVDDSILSPANDTGVYRATGAANSGSTTGMDAPFLPEHHPASEEHERQLAMLREHAVIVTVSPAEGQAANAREMLMALGGKLLRDDGRFEKDEAA